MLPYAVVFVSGAALGAFAAWTAARARAQRAEERCGRMLAFANHEINSPATAVNMTIVNLLSGVFGDVPADQQKWLELTREQVSRLNALVSELRDLVHLELLRDLHPIIADAAPAELAADALAGLRRGFEHSAVDLIVEVPEDLPKVRTDGDRVSRSLSSLLFHARKFRLSGPVRLRAAADDATVVFEVSYTGQVRSPEDVAASLDVWYPARPRKDQLLAATGLGLGLIKRVLSVCGGDLAFASDEKGRARLTVTVPVVGGE